MNLICKRWRSRGRRGKEKKKKKKLDVDGPLLYMMDLQSNG